MLCASWTEVPLSDSNSYLSDSYLDTSLPPFPSEAVQIPSC